MHNQLILWSSKICPFAHRTRIVLKEKNLKVQINQIDLDKKTPDFEQVYKKATFADPNSSGKVPTLKHKDIIMTESDIISWYLAETFPEGTQLIPQSTFERAKLRYFLNEVGNKIPGLYYSFINFRKNTENQKEILNKAKESLQKLNQSIVGPYILGENFSLADVMIWPWFDRWVAIEHYLTPGVKPSDWVKIANWIQKVSQRESIKETSGLNELYIEKTQKFFGNKA